ncbi:SET and MYND domain-containing protein 3 [Kappamyces sp. JEL0680]|nr:SET and MYND domain-containing protein 3 [Kappamyces sp. JEL0680]
MVEDGFEANTRQETVSTQSEWTSSGSVLSIDVACFLLKSRQFVLALEAFSTLLLDPHFALNPSVWALRAETYLELGGVSGLTVGKPVHALVDSLVVSKLVSITLSRYRVEMHSQFLSLPNTTYKNTWRLVKCFQALTRHDLALQILSDVPKFYTICERLGLASSSEFLLALAPIYEEAQLLFADWMAKLHRFGISAYQAGTIKDGYFFRGATDPFRTSARMLDEWNSSLAGLGDNSSRARIRIEAAPAYGASQLQLVANEFIGAGQVIIRETTRVVGVNQLDSRCAFCSRQVLLVCRCPGCLELYCGPACASQAMKTYHSPQFCAMVSSPRYLKAIRATNGPVLGPVTATALYPILARIYAIAFFHSCSPLQVDEIKDLQSYYELDSIYHSWDCTQDFFYIDLVDLFCIPAPLLGQGSWSFQTYLIVKGRVLLNQLMAGHAGGYSPTGCVFRTLSLANHSCSPSAQVFVNGNEAVLRAVRDLPPGTSIEISYCNPSDLKVLRGSELQLKWGFVCRCRLCLSEEENGADEVVPKMEWCMVTLD